MEKALRSIIEAHYEKCVARVIYRLRRISARGWQGDDAPERTLWDHWKREMQEEESLFHEMIEDMVEVEVWRVVERLPHEAGALMTMATDALDDLDEKPSEPIFDRDAVAAELMESVNNRAINEPHRKEVQRLLDDIVRDRFERDNERSD